jgi:hypothetical protein
MLGHMVTHNPRHARVCCPSSDPKKIKQPIAAKAQHFFRDGIRIS